MRIFRHSFLNKIEQMKNILILPLFLFIISCGSTEPEPIKVNIDQCEFCKMKISDAHFGSEIITKKGRIYKFDDVRCMVSYVKENKTDAGSFLVNDFSKENELIDATNAYFLSGGSINSPMRGNIVAFLQEAEATVYESKLNAKPVSWDEVLNSF